MTRLHYCLRMLTASITLAFAARMNAQSKSGGVVTLDPFMVQSQEVKSVHASESISATRFAANISELPFAVNVLTGQLLDDLAVTDVKDLLQFAGNVIGGEGTNAFNTTTNAAVRLRGFPSSLNLIDGFAVGINFRVSPLSIQRVEVVKGPASLLYGAVPPGGVVNFIRKIPTAVPHGSAKYTIGTWKFSRADLESSGPLTKNIRYAISVSQEDREFYTIAQARQILDISSQLHIDFAGKRGSVLLDYTHNAVDQVAVTSTMPLTRNTAKDPYGRFANEVDAKYPVMKYNSRDEGAAPNTSQSNNVLAQTRYIFSNQYTLRAAVRAQRFSSHLINQAVANPFPIFVDGTPGAIVLKPGDPGYGIAGSGTQWDTQGNDEWDTNAQVNLLMRYDFKWAKIQLMPGYDYTAAESFFWRYRAGVLGANGRRSGNFVSTLGKNIFNQATWLFDAPSAGAYVVDDPRTPAYEGPGLLRDQQGNKGSSKDYYIYTSGNFIGDKLIATFGYRKSSFENSLVISDEVRVPTRKEKKLVSPLSDSEAIYQYGLVGKVIPDKLHLYGNFAKSFQPQLRSIKLPDADNNPLDVDLDGDGVNDIPQLNDNPSKPANHLFGEGWEIGFKGTMGKSRIFTYSVAYFTTTNNNIIRNITVNPQPESYGVWFPNLSSAIKANLAKLPVSERLDEFQIQSGEEQSRGLELELTATPIKGWDLRATYTNLETKLLKDPSFPIAEGRTLPNSPKHNFNLFTRYGFTGGKLNGLFLGGSADYLSTRYSGNPQDGTAGLKSDPRTLINLFAGYRYRSGDRNYRFQVNAQNVTSERVSEGNNLGAIVAPCSFRVTVGVDY